MEKQTKNSKQAQLKIQEMSFMLLGVVLFFIIAALFFIAIKYRGMYNTSNQLEQEKTLSTVAKLADTAEFTCGKPLCIDADKIMVLKDRKAYAGFWEPIKSISVVRVFPPTNETLVECSKSNYPNCNYFKIYDSGAQNQETFDTFVSLCRKDNKNDYKYEKCELAKIVAGFEVNQAGE